MKKQKSIAIFLSICMLLALSPAFAFAGAKGSASEVSKTMAAVSYWDVSRSHWAIGFINRLSEKGIISGYQDGSFRPEANITRAEFAKIIVLAAGFSVPASVSSSFHDVPNAHWAVRYIEAAKANGVINGYKDGTFRSDAKVTRAEVAKMVITAGKFTVNRDGMPLTDINGHWAYDFIMTAKNLGIIGGYPDGSFAPNNATTRAEASKIVTRSLVDVLGKQVENPGIPHVSITGPTSDGEYTASKSSIPLSGTASDNDGIVKVTWTNSQGGSGTADGTTNWSVTSIDLKTGDNTITVIAEDAKGNHGSATIKVIYSAQMPTSSGGGGGPSTPPIPSNPSATISDSNGHTGTSVPSGGPAIITLSGLKPRTQYDVHVNPSDRVLIGVDESYLRLTSDEHGTIPATALAYDLSAGGYTYTVAEAVISESGSVSRSQTPVITGSFSAIEPTKKLEVIDDSAALTRSFKPGDDVFVRASGFASSAEVDLYVVSDQSEWKNGDPLRDVSATSVQNLPQPPYERQLDLVGTPERVQTDANGNIPATKIWSIPSDIAGGLPLDVVVDVNQNGVFDKDVDYVNDGFGVGFTVQEANITVGGDLVRMPGFDFTAQLASDASLNYRDTFVTSENVYVYINPRTRMQLGSDYWVKKYVVRHKDAWNTGDTLTDVSGPNNPWEADTVQSGCTNEGRVLVWPAPVTAGEYDVVIDVNRNGTYDEGVDILDGAPNAPGFVVVGTSQAQQPRKKKTIMVYMDGDNNLEGAAIDDLNEMEQVGSNNDMNIVVQIDRIPGLNTSNGDWTGARRYYVTRDSDQNTINSQLVSDLGEVNMGSSRTISEFAIWAMANYPADNYMLVVWDHGGGFRTASQQPLTKNIAWDDTNNGDSVSIPQLADSMRTIKGFLGRNLDILGMDACLMAMSEIAYEVSDSVNYMVGSEETEPGDGWPYDVTLQKLANNPSTSVEQLARWIVQDYNASYAGADSVTQSSIKLSNMGSLSSSINSFGQAMLAGIADQTNGASIKAALQNIRNNTQSYEASDYRDLYHFADQVSQSSVMTTEIKNAANAVKTVLTAAVIQNGYQGPTLADSHGLSIWLPDGAEYNNYIQRYGQLKFAADNVWDSFLAELWGTTMRIELTWGLEPHDLDSHLWDAYSNHLYYPNAGQGNSPIPGAWLDMDNTTSYGPENIRIESFQANESTTAQRYTYAVCLFLGSDSTEPVTVKVFQRGSTVPSNVFTKPGFDSANRWWYVFDIDPSTHAIIPVASTQGGSPRLQGSTGQLGNIEAFPPKK